MTVTTHNLLEAELPFVDIYSEEFAADPHAVLARARQRGIPFIRTDRGIEASSYDMVWTLLSHQGFNTEFAHHLDDAVITERIASWNENGLLLFMPAETHARVRKAVVRPFSAARIDGLKADMRRIAQRLAGDLPAAGCDLVAQFTHRYSIETLCTLLGVPVEHIPEFESATIDLRLGAAVPFAPVAEQYDRALGTLFDYSLALINERRQRPSDDFVSALVAGQIEDPRVTEPQLVWSIANLLFAGHDTTRYQLASVVRAIIESGSWSDLRANPDLIDAAVDEACRMYPVVQYLKRQANTADVEVDGWMVPSGTPINLNMLAASRDPETFEAPDEFRLPREGATYRAVYGWGVHRCVGHHLARTEMIEAVRVLTETFVEADLAGSVEVHGVTGMMGGPDQLPINLTRAGTQTW